MKKIGGNEKKKRKKISEPQETRRDKEGWPRAKSLSKSHLISKVQSGKSGKSASGVPSAFNLDR